ncbi:MAG: head-tail adaptor protein, partial [Christensenella sp.]
LRKVNNNYDYYLAYMTWASVEKKAGKTIYATFATAAENVIKLTMRIHPITRHDMIIINGQYHLITSIIEQGNIYMVLELAPIRLIKTLVKRNVDEKNNNIVSRNLQDLLTFPAIYAERYVRLDADTERNYTTSLMLVLIAPKQIELKVGDVCKAQNATYRVELTHLTHEYRNEYEVKTKLEA